MTPRSIPSPPAEWASFSIGIFTIHTYAICILIGIVVAILLTSRRLTKRGAEPGIVIDIALWAVPLGIVAARFYHVFTHPGDYFGAGKNLWAILFIWEGGNAIFGSLIGGAIGVLIGSRITGLRFWTFADALAPGLLLAQAFGRFGNWFNQELFGQPTNLPWGLQIDSGNPAFPAGLAPGTLFHPTFLYEILWNTFGAVLLLLLEREFRLQWGKLFALYLIWYGLGRIWFESIRVDPSEVFFGLRVNVWAAVLAVVLGIVILLVQRRRHPGVEPSPYLPGREWGRDQDQVASVYTAEDFERNGDGADADSEAVPATSAASSKSGTAKR